MGINVRDKKIHWNYFLALERDLEAVSRYIEFCEQNFSVFSIELAHLLFAASSEVDVVAKLLCQLVAPNSRRGNIDHYKAVLLPAFPDLPTIEVFVPRYGLSFRPWSNWAEEQNPNWWRSYNNVKHERDTYFHEATLENALSAVGALLIVTAHYYSLTLASSADTVFPAPPIMHRLEPMPSLLKLPSNYYHEW
jgi:hypothetical protein